MALIRNKKAGLAYEFQETLEAGIELHGFEVKALKSGKGSLDGAYVVIRGEEAFLLNAHIPAYQPANAPADYDPYRTRRLLLSKKEIAHLAGFERQKGLTIVPISFYNKHGKVKLEIAVARGKNKRDKRETIKARDDEREARRAMKSNERD